MIRWLIRQFKSGAVEGLTGYNRGWKNAISYAAVIEGPDREKIIRDHALRATRLDDYDNGYYNALCSVLGYDIEGYVVGELYNR